MSDEGDDGGRVEKISPPSVLASTLARHQSLNAVVPSLADASWSRRARFLFCSLLFRTELRADSASCLSVSADGISNE
jgi:hypothetical protein